MKKKKLLVLIIVLGLICTGCDGTVTRKIRQDGFSIGDKKFVCSTIVPEKSLFSEEEANTTEKIKFMSSNLIVSENGNLYEISLSGLYSNNMNCKKVGNGIKVVSMIDNEVVRAENGRYYYLTAGNNNVVSYSEVPKEDPKLQIYRIILDDNNVIKAMNINSNTNGYYVLKKNGNIYNYVFKQDEQTKEFKLLTNNIAYRSSEFDGNVIDFKYFGESTSTYFRTNKSIYRMKYTNMKECSKYVDIPCQYKLQKDEALTEYKDRILGYGGSVLITDYAKVFTVGS